MIEKILDEKQVEWLQDKLYGIFAYGGLQIDYVFRQDDKIGIKIKDVVMEENDD